MESNTTYYYRVRADKASVTGEGSYSNAVSVTTNPLAPTVTSSAATSISFNSATLGGNVTSDGGASVSERGIVYSSTDATPEIGEAGVTKDVNGTGIGEFSELISGLTSGTLYYVRAYATNSVGTSYGTEVNFTTLACVNPSSGGSITANQIICSGSAPATFSNTAAPSGHTGTLEYKWQKSTTSSTAGFADISSSNSATYSSAELTQTTWFKRLARVDCKSDWTGAAESNLILVKVIPNPADQTVSPASQTIISGNSATISISSSELSTSYYLRDNSDNTVVDGPKSGTGSAIDFNTGNLTSTKTFNVYAEKIHALQFDGTDDYVSVNHTFPAFNNYTISTWVYLTDGTNAKFFSCSQYELAAISGKVQLFIAGRSGINGTADLAMNQWNYITVTYDGTTLSTYINGNLDNSVATSVDVLPSSSNMKIGKHFSTPCCYVNGYMAELSFENNSHTQAEIQSKMMNGYTGSEPGLVACYNFGDGTGSSTLTDRTANHFNGTLVNMNTQTAWTSNCNQQMSATSTVTVKIIPTVITQDVSSISTSAATCNGNIVALGLQNPTAHGVCWNTTGTPTTDDSKSDEGTKDATGTFTTNLNNLTPNTVYYVRAYATNPLGTGYGEEIVFHTPASQIAHSVKLTKIARTSASALYENKTDLSVQLVITDDASHSYTESFTNVATNDLGIFSVNMGTGTKTDGDNYSEIAINNNTKVVTAIKTIGETEWRVISENKILDIVSLSAPFAQGNIAIEGNLKANNFSLQSESKSSEVDLTDVVGSMITIGNGQTITSLPTPIDGKIIMIVNLHKTKTCTLPGTLGTIAPNEVAKLISVAGNWYIVQ